MKVTIIVTFILAIYIGIKQWINLYETTKEIEKLDKKYRKMKYRVEHIWYYLLLNTDIYKEYNKHNKGENRVYPLEGLSNFFEEVEKLENKSVYKKKYEELKEKAKSHKHIKKLYKNEKEEE